MNWSKKDLNLDMVNQTSVAFKRFLSTVDPKMFSSHKVLQGTNGSKGLNNEQVSTNAEQSQVATYFSNVMQQPVRSNKTKDFYKIAMDINREGK